MRPAVGQILSGLALGSVATSMVVMPERFLVTKEVAVQGLVLRAPAERTVVRAAPIRPRRIHRSAPVKRPVTKARPAAITIAVSHRVPVLRDTEPPPPSTPLPLRPPPEEVTPPPPAPPPPPPQPPEASAPPVASPAIEIANARQKKDKKDKKLKKPKKSRDDQGDDEHGEGRGDKDEDRGDRGEDRQDKNKQKDKRKHEDDDD